jgi:hypothetical protein
MPNNSGFSSASVTYCVQSAANGTTLPVSVSASSVLGSTSGVAPAAGVIGESFVFTSRTTTGSSGAWVANTSALATLTPGAWSIRARATFSGQGAANCVIGGVSLNSTSDGTGVVASAQQVYSANANAANSFIIPLAEIQTVVVSSNTGIYAKSYSEDAAVNVTLEGFAIRIG